MTPSNWFAIGVYISTGTNLTTIWKKEKNLLILELIKPVLHALPTPMPSPSPVAEVVGGMSILTVLMILSVLMYFIPALVGMRHKQAAAIFVLNAFLGWTIVGWVAALVWACTHSEK